jgi:general secretion pathway protein I
LALVALFRAGGGGLAAVDIAARTEEAVQRAESHLAAVGHDVALLQGESEGDDGGGYRWRLRIAPVATVLRQTAPPLGSTLFEIEVAISWAGPRNGGGQGHRVVLRTRRLGAAATEP